MNNYISLDGYKYATSAVNWSPVVEKPYNERYTLAGDLDLTYGESEPTAYEGDIHAPVTARAVGWGTISTLRTTLVKKTAVNFTDHAGTSGTAHIVGQFVQSSTLNKWDDANNVWLVSARIVVV